MRTNLHHLIEDRARSHPGSPALTFKQQTLTYGELWAQITTVAAGLCELGVSPRQRVATFLEKRIETVAAIFATSVVGAASVSVNPLLRPGQVGHILRDCEVRTLVTTPMRLELVREELSSCPAIENVVLVGTPIEDQMPTAHYRVEPWERLRRLDGTAPTVDITDSDIAAIIYTSGSTGRPKGVMLSHRNVIVASVQTYLGNTADDVILAALPLSFDAGFSQLTMGFGVGAHVVLTNYLLPGDVPRLCAEHRVTGLTCVPPLWVQIVEQNWPAEAKASLRYFGSTGGRMPKQVLDRLREAFPSSKPFLMYGLTEAFRSTYLDPAEIDRRPGSIGKAVPGAEIHVVRPDGSPCDPGEQGELVHRGPHVALGYWNDPSRTAERFRPVADRDKRCQTDEREVWSGDTVITDDDGFIYFVGRSDEMIKTSGYRVSPTEIEEVAYSTGSVRDAVALGVEDITLGQRVLLIVAPASADFDTDALLAEMRSRLPHYMMPTSVVVRGALPRLGNGKFDRALLREEFAT